MGYAEQIRNLDPECYEYPSFAKNLSSLLFRGDGFCISRLLTARRFAWTSRRHCLPVGSRCVLGKWHPIC